MTTIIKYLTLTSIFAGLLAAKVGVMRGEADYISYPAGFDAEVLGSAELVNGTPITHRNIELGVTITGYSSRAQETDSTPFVTASGSRVHDGIVAANWLPFGAKVKIPALFGDKVFTVQDRMHPKNDGKLDVWFSETTAALKFGVRRANVEIL